MEWLIFGILPYLTSRRFVLPGELVPNQGQLSRNWKVQCDWLSLEKEYYSWLSRRLWGGTKYDLP